MYTYIYIYRCRYTCVYTRTHNVQFNLVISHCPCTSYYIYIYTYIHTYIHTYIISPECLHPTRSICRVRSSHRCPVWPSPARGFARCRRASWFLGDGNLRHLPGVSSTWVDVVLYIRIHRIFVSHIFNIRYNDYVSHNRYIYIYKHTEYLYTYTYIYIYTYASDK